VATKKASHLATQATTEIAEVIPKLVEIHLVFHTDELQLVTLSSQTLHQWG
jgi:hypothetical protein